MSEWPQTNGSQQLRRFRIAIRDGATVEDAAASSGLSVDEGRDWLRMDADNPPPPEALVLLGHNSEGANMAEERQEGMGGGRVAADELRLLIERVERLEEEKKGLADDIKDIFAEAKCRGYDAKVMRRIVALRKRKREDLAEELAILETYCNALGMQYALL